MACELRVDTHIHEQIIVSSRTIGSANTLFKNSINDIRLLQMEVNRFLESLNNKRRTICDI